MIYDKSGKELKSNAKKGCEHTFESPPSIVQPTQFTGKLMLMDERSWKRLMKMTVMAGAEAG